MNNQQINTYKDLIVWQKSMDLVIAVYSLTERFPKSELYGLVAQMRRCAVSIPSNIAEGRRRGSRKDYRQFLVVSYASGAELETQIEISKRLPFGRNLDYTKIDSLLNEVMRMLNKMTNELNS
ncbi:four helix bundle protein [Candidatus Collierbacteria bacterium]|nr:four helix bundle protein [Candidatus Collierbacteria bacterium]